MEDTLGDGSVSCVASFASAAPPIIPPDSDWTAVPRSTFADAVPCDARLLGREELAEV